MAGGQKSSLGVADRAKDLRRLVWERDPAKQQQILVSETQEARQTPELYLMVSDPTVAAVPAEQKSPEIGCCEWSWLHRENSAVTPVGSLNAGTHVALRGQAVALGLEWS